MSTAFTDHCNSLSALSLAQAALEKAQNIASEAHLQHQKDIADAGREESPSSATITKIVGSQHLAAIANARIENLKKDLEEAQSTSDAAFKLAIAEAQQNLGRWVAENYNAEMNRILPNGGNGAQQNAAGVIINQSEKVVAANQLSISLMGAKNDEHGAVYLKRAQGYLS